MNIPLTPAPLYPTLDDITELTVDQIIEALEAARDHVRAGWTTGTWFTYDAEGIFRVCLEGALIAALWGIPENEVGSETTPSHHDDLLACPVYGAVIDTLNIDSYVDEYGERVNSWDSAAEYNDNDGRTDKEIDDLLTDTIKRLRG